MDHFKIYNHSHVQPALVVFNNCVSEYMCLACMCIAVAIVLGKESSRRFEILNSLCYQPAPVAQSVSAPYLYSVPSPPPDGGTRHAEVVSSSLTWGRACF